MDLTCSLPVLYCPLVPASQRPAARLLALAAAALLLAACGGSPDTAETATTAAPASDGGSASSTTAPEQTSASSTDDATVASAQPSAADTGSGDAVEEYAVDGGYAFSALDQDMYCVLNPAEGGGGNVVAERLDVSSGAGVHCVMASYAPADTADSQDDGIAACLESSAQDGIGESSGGEPSLTADQVSYSGCRTDVTSFQDNPSAMREALGDVVALEPGQSISTDGYTCEAIGDSVQCTRADGRGWKVSTSTYEMIS